MRAAEATSGDASKQKKTDCFVHYDEQQARRRERVYFHQRAKNLRKWLADGFVRSGCRVERVDNILCGSYSRCMCSVHPKKTCAPTTHTTLIGTTKTTVFC